MKILKYILLLLVLSSISLTVFIATQNSSYTIIRSKEIQLPKRIVYNYLNELKNAEQWQVFNDNVIHFSVDSLSKGKQAKISWQNTYLKNTDVFPTDSLFQELNIDEKSYSLKWKLSQKDKNTLLSLQVEGKMDFMTKLKSFFLNNVIQSQGLIYEKTLNSINYHVTQEYNKFEIKNEDIVFVKEQFYIKQIVYCTAENLSEQIFDTMNNLKRFCNENDLIISGNPFTIFERIDFQSKKIEYAVYLPITTEIFTNEGSDILTGKTPSFHAYKTTLIGDYSHSDKAWKENEAQLVANNLNKNTTFKPLSIYKKTKSDTNQPSKWITEFLTPVNESVIFIPEVQKDSLQITQ